MKDNEAKQPIDADAIRKHAEELLSRADENNWKERAVKTEADIYQAMPDAIEILLDCLYCESRRIQVRAATSILQLCSRTFIPETNSMFDNDEFDD